MKDLRIGPLGGWGGVTFDDYTAPLGAKLKEIRVFADQYVHAFQFVYIDSNGAQVELPRVGGPGGKRYVFSLDEDEYITAISGLNDWYIDSIRFHTNKRTTDRYGGTGTAHEFRHEVPSNYAIVGLFGRSDWYIDAVGVIARPITNGSAPATKSKPKPVSATQDTKSKPVSATQDTKPKPVSATQDTKPKPVSATQDTKAKSPPPVTETPREARPDDLQKVEGIGPKIANLLIENGIVNLHDLANTSAKRIKAILTAAGNRYALADPETWPKQAALGARGDWEGLKALQKQLNQGRKV